jgi:hypothetical protein
MGEVTPIDRSEPSPTPTFDMEFLVDTVCSLRNRVIALEQTRDADGDRRIADRKLIGEIRKDVQKLEAKIDEYHRQLAAVRDSLPDS